MEQSLFIEFVDRYFSKVVGQITEKYNGKTTEPTLLHKQMLTEEYSADLQWGATELDRAVVAADVVSLESSLPLKRRDKLSNATGSLPKIGIKMRKGEKLITDINIMQAKGADQATIAEKIFDDVNRVIKATDVTKEIMFEQGLSTGQYLAEGDAANATGVRVSFGYKSANIFGAKTAAWLSADGKPDAKALPADDIQQLFDKAGADGVSLSHVWMSKRYFDTFRKSDQGKQLYAAFSNFVVTDKALLPQPGRQAFLSALADEYGATFHVIDSVFTVEGRDGNRTNVRPWREANIVATPTDKVGRLVYGTLAEETHPVDGVVYQKSGTHVLVSKYSKNDPLEEFTAAQALCLPVIDGAESIYVLEADRLGISATPAALDFPKSASTKKVDIATTADGLATAKTTAAWLTLTIAGKSVNVAAAANTSAARTAVITITDTAGQSIEVTASQADGTAAPNPGA